MTGMSATTIALSVVLGSSLGVGLWSLSSLIPRLAAPTLAQRIAPYIRDVTHEPDARPFSLATSPGLVGLDLRRFVTDIGLRITSLLGASQTIEIRLARAGWTVDIERFRARQLAWAAGGLVVGGGAAVGLALAVGFTPAAVLVPPLSVIAAIVAYDGLLQIAARRRLQRMQDELPILLEFMSLCLSAGEGILDVLRRVSAVGSGDLTAEWRSLLLEVGTGIPLTDAISGLGSRLQMPSLSRACDQLIAAIERGAPLAVVLRAQADDAREDAKRALIERAGRSEILMLFPLVFLILPLSVIFAVYPGVFLLRLDLP